MINFSKNRIFLVLSIIIIFVVVLSSCQAESSSDRRSRRTDSTTREQRTTTAETEEIETTITTEETTPSVAPPLDNDGERMTFDHFSVFVIDGYYTLELMGGVQVYRGFDAVEIWVRPTTQSDDEALTDAAQLASWWDGTDPVSVEYFGLTFYSTRLTFAGMDQTILTCITNGYKIQITIAGSDHENKTDLMNIFDSIVFDI